MYRNREEELFWRMIDTYGEHDPDGIGSSYDCRRGSITGIYYDVSNTNIVSPFLKLRCCVNSSGINCSLFTSYEGGNQQYIEERGKLIPEFQVIVEKFYTWEDFYFDEFITWMTSYNDWEKVLNIYKT